MEKCIIVAVADNWAIGRKNALLWNLPEGIIVVKSLDEAYAAAEKVLETTGGDKCFVIGGAYTYAEALQSADTLHITHVHDSPKDADAFFPKIDPQVFRVDSVAPQETDPQSGICYNFTIYKRR